jgi:lipopolysaccharide transport protein LptA/LPS export ABC transporter protein LptC
VPLKPHRTIRFLLLVVLSILTVAVGYALLGRQRQGSRPLAELETGENVSQRAINLDSTRTRRGLPSFRVRAREAFTYKEGNRELHDVVVTLYGAGKNDTEVQAPLALSAEGEGGGWTFQNGVEIRGDNGLRLRVPELRYRESLQEVSSDGDVAFQRDDLTGSARGLRYLVSRRRLDLLSQVEINGDPNGGSLRRIRAGKASMDRTAARDTFQSYTAETSTGEVLSGATLDLLLDPNSSKVRRMEATGGFRLISSGGARAASQLGHGSRELTGDSLSADLLPGGAIGSAIAVGGVSLRVSDAGAGERTLTCPRLTMAFTEGRLSTVSAEEDAMLVVPPADAGKGSGETRLRARTIRTEFKPEDGSLIGGLAEGDVTAEQGSRRMSAPRMTFDAAGDLWILDAGEPKSVARVEGDGGIVTAAHIEIRKNDGTLLAKGDVKTTTQPRAGDPGSGGTSTAGPRAAGAFLGGDGPIHGISGSLALSRDGRTVKYREKVRIWQGGSSLEAPVVDVADEAGTVEAHGGVVARSPAKGRDPSIQQIATISANDLAYHRDTGVTLFAGNVRAQTEGARIEAESILARGAGGGGIQELEATGKVKFQEGTKNGEGDLLTVDLKDDRYVLSGRGRIVTIQDQSSQQFVKGVVLTYQGAADRILVESETGGRTWITLKPRAKEGKKSGPESPH